MLHIGSCNENPSSVLGFKFHVFDVLSCDFLYGIFSCSFTKTSKPKIENIEFYTNTSKI